MPLIVDGGTNQRPDQLALRLLKSCLQMGDLRQLVLLVLPASSLVFDQLLLLD